MKRIFFLFVLMLCFSTLSLGQDCWLAPNAKGKKNGSSSENAYGPKAAQKCWNKTSPNGTMYVEAGNYAQDSGQFWSLKMDFKHSGPADASGWKQLKGLGRVSLVGKRPVPYTIRGASLGGNWITFLKGAHHIRIENFNVARVETGIVARSGENHHVELEKINFEDTRQNILIEGHPHCHSLKDCTAVKKYLSHNFKLDEISGIRYSKRHIRMGRGISNVTVSRSTADSQFLDGDFAVGFDVETPAWDIQFLDCIAKRNRFSQSEYWNGDGFKSELQTSGIRWVRCAAFYNADAGFDIKSEDAFLENITAQYNSRNIRIWGHAVLKKIDASYSESQGGNASQAGLWIQGKAECHFCTLKNNAIQVHLESNHKPSKLTLFDSTLVLDQNRASEMIRKEEGAEIHLIRTKTVGS